MSIEIIPAIKAAYQMAPLGEPYTGAARYKQYVLYMQEIHNSRNQLLNLLQGMYACDIETLCTPLILTRQVELQGIRDALFTAIEVVGSLESSVWHYKLFAEYKSEEATTPLRTFVFICKQLYTVYQYADIRSATTLLDDSTPVLVRFSTYTQRLTQSLKNLQQLLGTTLASYGGVTYWTHLFTGVLDSLDELITTSQVMCSISSDGEDALLLGETRCVGICTNSLRYNRWTGKLSFRRCKNHAPPRFSCVCSWHSPNVVEDNTQHTVLVYNNNKYKKNQQLTLRYNKHQKTYQMIHESSASSHTSDEQLYTVDAHVPMADILGSVKRHHKRQPPPRTVKQNLRRMKQRQDDIRQDQWSKMSFINNNEIHKQK